MDEVFLAVRNFFFVVVGIKCSQLSHTPFHLSLVVVVVGLAALQLEEDISLWPTLK